MDVSLCRGEFQKYRIFGIFSLFACASVFGVPLGARAEEVSLFEENVLEFRQNATSLGEGVVTAESPSRCEEPSVRGAEESEEDYQFRLSLEEMLREKPMIAMAPLIAKRDRETAAFLVAIARKESSWGERAPSKNGVDCFNYWGYKGAGSRGVGMGHACFGSPEEAVEVVGNRIATLVHEKKLNSPERLIVWKCGRSCEGHSPESVAKWISDVRFIYTRVLPKG